METANSGRKLKRVVIDPVSRVEGHGKVTLLVDDQNIVQQARLHIVEFRGFERFIQGRPFWELPMVVQRLCGICPVSHHLAAGKAIDMLVGAKELTATAEKIRRLAHYGQVLQSHALHFFHLASPDLVFGIKSDAKQRNVINVLDKYPDIALKGVKLRKFGQQLIEVISGKRVHGSIVIPGGVNKSLKQSEISDFQQQMDQILIWSQEALELAKTLYLSDIQHQGFGAISSPTLSLVDSNGGFELYDGNLRIKDSQGVLLHDQIRNQDYGNHILEEVKPWSYMKFPFLKDLGIDQGWYRVGPLARILNSGSMGFPLSEAARQELVEHCNPAESQSALLYHWARMIELLACSEAIQQLLKDPDLCGDDRVMPPGKRQSECYGIIEAPRGTLIHHYLINDQDIVEKANLIVSTTSNNQAMNEAVRSVCRQYLNGNPLSEGLLNHVEVAIRAYDPCLSCATHALGKMPLEIELVTTTGEHIGSIRRGG